jgi:2-keto-4-pentenoate hydratase/2-oxohepta-3-ene-1,7-dioic acid hydratase in catechol pathway
MKLLTFLFDAKEQVGILSKNEDFVYPVKNLGYPFESMNELIRETNDAMLHDMANIAIAEKVNGYPLKSVRLLAPILHPVRDIVCMGLNYLSHAEEVARALKEDPAKRTWPIFFGKAVDRARGDGETIPSHKGFISTLDYECELAAILKKDARNVRPEEVKEYIFGYTIINDITARELNKHKQNYFQKSLDGTCPMGPWIVTADEIAFPPALKLQLEVNGELRQDSCTDQMIFDLKDIVSELTKGMTLQAGTIIATGSPTGIGFAMNPPVFLKDGDHIRCRIAGIGELNTYVTDFET